LKQQGITLVISFYEISFFVIFYERRQNQG
jgi:hypothetical protein